MLTNENLIDYFRSGCKSPDDLKMGLEWEQFTLNAKTGNPLPYHGDVSVFALLNGLIAEFGWTPDFEEENIIALHRTRKDGVKQVISLEPGGQIELSGGLHRDLEGVKAETFEYHSEIKTIGDQIGIVFLPLGFIPDKSREDFQYVPKPRYEIMKRYMPKRGSMGADMMLRTCTVQVNLDYTSEQDMARKFRVSLALQPLATALFANSRTVDGKDSGFFSYRSQVWLDTDPDRTGVLPFVFEENFGFQDYADYALDVPMYFVKRDGHYIDTAGESFRSFIEGKLPQLPGEKAKIKDWEDHLTTLFPEVRLKKFLEMRGADSVPLERTTDLAELWAHLLYSEENLTRAEKRIQNWSAEDVREMRVDVPKNGFRTRLPDHGVIADLFEELTISPALFSRGAAKNI